MRPKHIIFYTVAGSRLYGTSTPESDMDYRGVAMEPVDSILGLQSFKDYNPQDGEVDEQIYGLRNFAKLALENNPNIIELLFAPALFYTSEWLVISKIRNSFLSTKIAKTFVGYAVAQLKRIRGHYKWMTDEEPQKPDPKDYGRIVYSDGREQWTDYHKKQEYDNDLKHYQQYQTWLANRNDKRHELEVKYGYDTKHGMHLVRLLQQGEELLTTGNLILPRPNADELLAIRNGSMEYEDLLAWADQKILEVENIKSVLPSKPDWNKVNQVVMLLNNSHINKRNYDD